MRDLTTRFVVLFSVISACFVLPLTACTQTRAVEHRQLYVGFNGPKITKVFYFENEEAIEKSWLKRAIPASELESLVREIDLSRHIVVAFAIGERQTANGSVKISGIRTLTREPFSLNVSALVGVVDLNCAESKESNSYPFVVASFERPEKYSIVGGMDIANFAEGCKSAKSGAPNDP
jgi:hypothetical protein